MVKHTLRVEGMHCSACECFLEETARTVPGIERAKACLADQCMLVEGTQEDAVVLARVLSDKVGRRGYRVVPEGAVKGGYAWRDILVAIPMAALALFLLLTLETSGLVSLSGGANGYTTAFFVGVIASVSTCMATVGALVVSLSAREAQQGARKMRTVWFHVGRIAGFFLLGGVIGLLGQTVRLGIAGQAWISIAIALVILLLGMNLLEVMPSVTAHGIRLPKSFHGIAKRASALPTWIAPILTGVATFFLPCGFTQSMQLFALSTGSFMAGAWTMFVFSLGTLPMLALLSFTSFTILNKPWKGVFFKTAGFVVIGLAMLTLYRQTMLLLQLS